MLTAGVLIFAVVSSRVPGARPHDDHLHRTPLASAGLRAVLGVTFLLGAERLGLPDEVVRDVDAWIPIAGAESLNVAAAGAIALYEWRRQN